MASPSDPGPPELAPTLADVDAAAWASADTVAVPDPRAPGEAEQLTLDFDYQAFLAGAEGGPPAGASARRGPSRYEPGQVLGAGGMGEVRLHKDRRIGRRVARKTMHDSADPLVMARFLREVRVQGQLEHPAVVPVYDLDVDDQNQVYFTMKRVRGETLESVLQHLRKGDPAWTHRFGARRLLSAYAQVCLAVHYAHTRKVLHRDLKPSNLMFGDFGEVYVLDWGIAKVLGEAELPTAARGPREADPADPATLDVAGSTAVVADSGSLTVGGAVLGTLAYMAPEQLDRDATRLDARTDVYALGAILFEILTLTPLRRGADARELLQHVTAKEVPRPSDRTATVPPELDELCVSALQPDPARRPSTAGELAEAVERYLDGDHNLTLRKELARKHATAARERLGAPTAGAAGSRVEALRETMKALTLDADQGEAQQLLVELLTDVSGTVPAEAKEELDASVDRQRATGARVGRNGLLALLTVVPVVMLIGVKSWLALGATALATLFAAVAAHWASKQARHGTSQIVLLAALVAAMLTLQSCYMGPFTLVPTCAATCSMFFGLAAVKRERWLVAGILSLGALVPFVAEALHLGPPAYAFEADRLIVFARAIELPRGPTLAAMAYSTVAYTVLSMVLVGSVRDALSEAEQSRFLQAWHLRQLFPGAGRVRAEGGTGRR